MTRRRRTELVRVSPVEEDGHVWRVARDRSDLCTQKRSVRVPRPHLFRSRRPRPTSLRFNRHRQLRASCATPAAATTTNAPRRPTAAPTTSARDIPTTRRSTPTACAAARTQHRGRHLSEARRRPRTPASASRVTRAGAAPTAPRRPTAEATVSVRASPTTPPSTRAASAAPGRDVRLPSSFLQ